MDNEPIPQQEEIKPPKELEQQVKLVNLHQIKTHKRPFEVPQLAIEDPKRFMEGYKELQHQGVPREGTPYERFGEYQRALVNVRESQRNYIHDVLADTSPDTKLDSYKEAIRFSPEIAREVLVEKINFRSPYSKEATLLTQEELSRGLQNEEGFLQILNTALDRDPKKFFSACRYLVHLLPPERIKDVISKVENKASFANNFSTIKQFFTPEERKQYLSEFLSEEDNPGASAIELFKDPDAVALFTPEEIHTAHKKALTNTRMLYSYRLDEYLEEGIITRDDLEEIIVGRIKKFKSLVTLDHIVELLPDPDSIHVLRQTLLETCRESPDIDKIVEFGEFAILTPEQETEILKLVTEKDKSKALREVNDLERILQSPQTFGPILRELLSEPNLDINDNSLRAVLGAESISDNEKITFISSVIDSGQAALVLKEAGRLVRIRSNVDPLVRKLYEEVPYHDFIENFYLGRQEGWGAVASGDFLKEVIDSTNINNAGNWIDQIAHWHEFRGNDPNFTSAFLEKYKTAHSINVMDQLEIIRDKKIIAPDKIDEFALDVLKSQPVYAFELTEGEMRIKFGRTFTPGEIIHLAKTDTERFKLAPKNYQEFLDKYDPAKDITEQKTVAFDAFNIYESTNFIVAAGLGKELQTAIANNDLSIISEKEFVNIYYCFAMLKDTNPVQFASITNLGTTLEESREILYSQVSSILEMDNNLTREQIETFQARMETATPFLIYALQFHKSEVHKNLLSGAFAAIADGKFAEWKYGELTEANLQALKDTKLIPGNVTLEQYTAWTKDGQTSLFDSLSTDTQTVASSIAQYLEGNLHHLHIQDTMDRLMEAHPDQDMLASINSEFAIVGQRLAQINRTLKTDEVQRDDVTRAALLDEKQQLTQTRNELTRTRTHVRLLTIQPDEVAAGAFLDGKDKKARGQSLRKVISELKAEADSGDEFIYEAIQNMLDDQQTAVDSKQNLICEDSSDPKVWIEIGEKPTKSCQSYNRGIENESLVAYTDPNTKILTLWNERGSIIGRSIFRMLAKENGDPALHVERVYSSTTSKGVLRSIFARAAQKADDLDMPLLMSDRSQNEDGEELAFEVAEGYKADPVDYALFSHASRGTTVYVDSAGGQNAKGDYEMKGLMEISKIAA